MSADAWGQLDTATSALVNVSVLIAAAVAVVKWRLYNLFAHRWRSELECRHVVLPDRRVVFTADYTVHNTGQRPLALSEVRLRLVRARIEDTLLVPDAGRVLAARVCRSDDPGLRGHFRIESGERTIFTLRCALDALDEVVFVLCDFDTPCRRAPAGFRGLYVKSGARDAARDTPVPTPPPDDDGFPGLGDF